MLGGIQEGLRLLYILHAINCGERWRDGHFLFGLAESQVSATGPMDSGSGFSRRHELSGAAGRGEGAALVVVVQPMQPCETPEAFATLTQETER